MNLLFQISASELVSNSAGHVISANDLGFETFLNYNGSPIDAILGLFLINVMIFNDNAFIIQIKERYLMGSD